MKQQKKATREQIGRIVGMLVSGQVPFGEAQAIIEGHAKHTLDAVGTDPDVVYWEQHWPGKGCDIAKGLKPYYGWKPELKPALPDLVERAKRAIFWYRFPEMRGVQTFRLSQLRELEATLDYRGPGGGFWPKDSLAQDAIDSLITLSGKAWSDVVRDSDLDVSIFAWWDSVDPSVRLEFEDSIAATIYCSFSDLLVFSVFALAGGSDVFKAIGELYLEGNFPVGFDKEGNLLVLVAS